MWVLLRGVLCKGYVALWVIQRRVAACFLSSIKRSARGFRDGGVRPLDDVADESRRKMPGFRIVEHAPESIVQVIRSAVGHPEARSGLFFEQH